MNFANKYDAIIEAVYELRGAADVVLDATVKDPDLTHLAPLAAQVPENLLAVLDSLLDAIPGELGNAMEAAQEFAGE
jgi:hypothetical protein